jgi:hypothetical protein
MRLNLQNTAICGLLLATAVGCKKAPPVTAPTENAAKTAAALPAEATPVALPASVTVVAEPPPGPTTALHLSVNMLGGPGLKDGMPSQGEPAAFQVTLRDADGQFVSELEPLLGGKILLVAARADLGWSTVMRAEELSDKVRGRHEFRMIFPFSGIHRVWFLYRYHGKTFSEELVFTVAGKPWVGKELPESQVQWQDDKGLAARLKVEPAVPQTCEPFLLATAWTRHDKPLRMTAEPDTATTWYVAIEGGLGEVATSNAEPVGLPNGSTESMATKLGGDVGTVATLRVSRPGRYRVLAVATPPGAKAGQKDATVVAPFVITVGGTLHEGGCGQ